MAIYEDLVEVAQSLGRGKRIKRAVISLFYAFSELERGGSGLAYVDKDLVNSCCDAREMHFWNEPADLIVKSYLQGIPLESTLALSVINALINQREAVLKEYLSEDPFSKIPLSKEDSVLMIGYFQPLFKKLEGKVKSIYVIEKEGGITPEKFITKEEDFKLAIVTSATLANKTLHQYFPVLEKIPEVVLMGPTTPLCPEVFKYTPIKWLCGAIVKDSELLFRLVCEGKGTPAFFKYKALEKINLKIK